MKRSDTVLREVARLVRGPSLVVAVGLMVKAYSEVGDGFAAGVVVALAVALSFVALGAAQAERELPFLRFTPALAVGGLVLSLLAGFFPLALGQQPFSHLPGPGEEVATVGALELFTPLLFDLGVFFLVVGVLTVLLHQLADPDSEAGDPVDDSIADGGRR
ncbi:MnhB domain-containing protein [Geodermatophilus sp. URMC 64]